MRSKKEFSSILLGVGMVAMLLFTGLPVMTDEVLAVQDKIAMLNYTWLPMRTDFTGLPMRTDFTGLPVMTDEVLAVQDKIAMAEIYPTASNGSVWYLNKKDPQGENTFYFKSWEDLGLDEE